MQKVTVQNKIIIKLRFHLKVSKNKPHRYAGKHAVIRH